MKKPLVINLFGGPGVGKSSTAAFLFGKLKSLNYNVELIHEYAKKLTWKENNKVLGFQPYVTAKQMLLQYECMDKVDIIITDSPIITGLLYQGFGCSCNWESHVLDVFDEFENAVYFLHRNSDAHAYNVNGRRQTEEESKLIDDQAYKSLFDYEIPFTLVRVEEGFAHVEHIYNQLKEKYFDTDLIVPYA